MGSRVGKWTFNAPSRSDLSAGNRNLQQQAVFDSPQRCCRPTASINMIQESGGYSC